jgi:RND family efflux transporter MFP subunit
MRPLARAITLCIFGACAILPGCQPTSHSSPAASPPPAKVSGAPKESDLGTVQLTPEAEGRLGIETVSVIRRPVPRAASYGGEVLVPIGRMISVSSPFVATVKAPENGKVPLPGSAVTPGQPIFVLTPILSPEARATMASLIVETEGQVKQAEEQLKIARITLERAESLVRQKLGGSAAVVDAKAQADAAATALRAAQQRQEIVVKVATEADAGALTAPTIESPIGGMILNLHAQVGQKVAAGAILFDVAGLDPIWVKVPVYVGDLARIATNREARVGGLADPPGLEARPARPVTATPSGDPLAATVNLYYEVGNPDGTLRPGQRVGVTLPLQGDEESLVVPRSALIRDVQGGTWVYEGVAPHAFARRRVAVDRVVDNDAAVIGALKPGARVVSSGAAELFGTEFGNAK